MSWRVHHGLPAWKGGGRGRGACTQIRSQIPKLEAAAAPPGAASREGSSAAAWGLTMGASVLESSVNGGPGALLARRGPLELVAPMLHQRAGDSACVLTALTGVT